MLTGHWHDGEAGEANRTDPNACGRPVNQALSNYQSRVNGGDAGLRHYTFKPSSNRIEAYAYSPSRGEFESDANSQFSLSHDMTTEASAVFAVPASTLHEGVNTIAANAHLNYQDTTDMGFDLVLRAARRELPHPTKWPARGIVDASSTSVIDDTAEPDTEYINAVVAVGWSGLVSAPGTASVTTPDDQSGSVVAVPPPDPSAPTASVRLPGTPCSPIRSRQTIPQPPP